MTGGKWHEKKGYDRKTVRADLRNPMVEMCPFIMENGKREVIEETRTARVWTGWSAFDVAISSLKLISGWTHAIQK